jgi:hypothetical protein
MGDLPHFLDGKYIAELDMDYHLQKVSAKEFQDLTSHKTHPFPFVGLLTAALGWCSR